MDLHDMELRIDRHGLKIAGRRDNGFNFTCPFHDDRTPSAWAFNTGRRIKLGCFACGNIEERLLRYFGLTFKDTKLGNGMDTNSITVNPKWIILPTMYELGLTSPIFDDGSAIYKYKTYSGLLYGYVVRYDKPDGKKSFAQITHGYFSNESKTSARFARKGFGDGRPPYVVGYPTNQNIVVVEGEKTALEFYRVYRTLQSYIDNLPNIAVVTAAASLHGAKVTNWGIFRGKNVIVWPDNDMPGMNFAKVICAKAIDFDCYKVSLINPRKYFPGLPLKWDLADSPVTYGYGYDRIISVLTSCFE